MDPFLCFLFLLSVDWSGVEWSGKFLGVGVVCAINVLGYVGLHSNGLVIGFVFPLKNLIALGLYFL